MKLPKLLAQALDQHGRVGHLRRHSLDEVALRNDVWVHLRFVAVAKVLFILQIVFDAVTGAHGGTAAAPTTAAPQQRVEEEERVLVETELLGDDRVEVGGQHEQHRPLQDENTEQVAELVAGAHVLKEEGPRGEQVNSAEEGKTAAT